MGIHNVSKKDWPKLTWKYPLIHNFEFGAGLSQEAPTVESTIVPYFFQDNALVDYENVKTNPENADFNVVSYPNVMAGSYIPKVQVHWECYIPLADVEIKIEKFNTMMINISMLSRLDAFDKKTGNDIETILELQHETTDEQCYPLWNGSKTFEAGGTFDYHANVPGLTTTQQPEGVNFDKELFFDALHYYTNKEMLKLVTQRMRTYVISAEDIPFYNTIQQKTFTMNTPSLCKFQHPYTFCGELFHLPQASSKDQYHLAGETTAIEHLRMKGWVRFYEFNPDFNFARA